MRPVKPKLQRTHRRAVRRVALGARLLAVVLLLVPFAYLLPATVGAPAQAFAGTGVAALAAESNSEGSSLESAASKAGETGRKIAMSLIGLAFAVAAVVLVFKRDFRDAVGVLVVGVIAVLLASPVCLTVVQDTVNTLFG